MASYHYYGLGNKQQFEIDNLMQALRRDNEEFSDKVPALGSQI